MAGERLTPPVFLEFFSRVSGISVVTKTVASGCPLAEMISRSGINNVLPSSLNLQVNSGMRQDYQRVVTAGDVQGLNAMSFVAPINSFGISIPKDGGLVYFRLNTLMRDNNWRLVPILVGLRGVIANTTREYYWQVMQQLFPNLRFMASDREIEDGEQESLATQNIVPVPVFDLSKNLPRIKRDEPVLVPISPAQAQTELRLDETKRAEIRGYLARYNNAMFSEERYRIMELLSSYLPDFSGIQDGNITYRLGSVEGGRNWTIAEIEELLRDK